MWSYTAYGLDIRSDIGLPELISSEEDRDPVLSSIAGVADVIIRVDDMSPPLAIPDNTDTYTHVSEGETVLAWRGAGTFLVREGREIVILPEKGVEERTLRVYLLGSVFGVLLHQRGKLALHASAVAINDGACLFVGGSGWGKSTMSAALHARGHNVIADDVTLIDKDDEGNFVTMPAFPRLKLWPESVQAIGYDPETLPLLRTGLSKRSFQVEYPMATQHIPLSRIYILERGSALRILPIRPVDALLELAAHAYGAKLLKNVRPAAQFQEYSRVACAVPVRRLTRPWSLGHLSALVKAVEEDVLAD